jgi:glycosyltransferase involved in cell wall biosynthesis
MYETSEFEKVVGLCLENVAPSDLKEIIVVYSPRSSLENVASIDKIRTIVEETGASYIKLLQTRKFMGGAMRDGIDIARGSHIIIMDAGMATDPNLVPQMIELAKKYPNDIIKASRIMKGGSLGNGYDPLKKIWNKFSQFVISIYYLHRLMDFTFPYWIVPTRYYQAVEWKEDKHPFNIESVLKFLKLGIKIREAIPAVQTGGTQSGYKETLGYFKPMLKIRFMRKKNILKDGVSIQTLGEK